VKARTLGAAAAVAGVALVVAILMGRQGSEAPMFAPRPEQFVRDLQISEDASDRYQTAVKSTLMKGIRDGDWTLARRALTPDFRARFPKAGDGSPVPDEVLSIRELGPIEEPILSADDFLAALRTWVQPWAAVERLTWRTFTHLLQEDLKGAWCEVHFQIAGRSPDGAREDLQGTLQVQTVLDGSDWKLSRLSWKEGWFVGMSAPAFADITDVTGLHFNESEENRRISQEIINNRALKTAGGLSAVDWNGDGFWDVLATLANRYTVLFENDGRGGFARSEGLFPRPEECGFMCMSVDLDEDGVDELVTTQVVAQDSTTAELGLYRRNNGRWDRIPGALQFEPEKGRRRHMVQVLLPGDADRDGRVDLFVGIYADSASGEERFNAVASYDGGKNLLFMNRGGLRFSEESADRGLVSTQFTLAAQFFDLDGDGIDDLFEGNDFGPDIVWLNDGKGRFRQDKGNLLARDSTYTMGVSIADWDNTGLWSVYIANMYSHAGNRIVPLASGLSESMRKTGMILAQGNQMFERAADGTWTETGAHRNVAFADWAWANPFLDWDNDADKDIFVATGYTSHEDPKAPDW
jgi:hypothetical protein